MFNWTSIIERVDKIVDLMSVRDFEKIHNYRRLGRIYLLNLWELFGKSVQSDFVKKYPCVMMISH